MNKTELVTLVALRQGKSQAEVARILDEILAEIGTALVHGEKVTLLDFGTLEAYDRAARTGRNPRTGEAVPIAPARVVRFRSGRALRQAVAEHGMDHVQG
jgi:DNA-binding protein HU-beta